MFERMNRFLEAAAPRWTETMAWAPLADLYETGLKREDIDVEVSERELCITGELKEREGVLRRATRRSGHFEYRSLLPAEVNSEQVSASLADGILTVTVPKTQATNPRHIEITT
jgi:HSP20 family protein